MNIFAILALVFLVLTIALFRFNVPSSWPYIAMAIAAIFAVLSNIKFKRRKG